MGVPITSLLLQLLYGGGPTSKIYDASPKVESFMSPSQPVDFTQSAPAISSPLKEIDAMQPDISHA